MALHTEWLYEENMIQTKVQSSTKLREGYLTASQSNREERLNRRGSMIG